MSRVVLDATLSEDRDNSEGELRFYCPFNAINAYFCKYFLPLYTFPLCRFQWSCQVAFSGAGCFVYSGASGAPQRLEEALDTGTLARSARALTHEFDV